jgi:nicotinamidase-related amidase
MMSDVATLLVVDLQKAAFGGYGIPPAHQAERLLRNAYVLLQEARASGVPVVHIQHCGAAGEAFEEGAPGWPIVSQLQPIASERVVRKRASNAFEGTELRAVLQELGAGSVVITGVQSERCVSATCRGALGLGYGVRLARDAHSTWPDGARSAAEIIATQNEALEREGARLGSTEELVQQLRSTRRGVGRAP